MELKLETKQDMLTIYDANLVYIKMVEQYGVSYFIFKDRKHGQYGYISESDFSYYFPEECE